MEKEMKKCLHCGRVKPLNDFVKSKLTKSGYLGNCKKCESKRVMEKYYYQAGKYVIRQKFNYMKWRFNNYKFKTINKLTFEEYEEVIKRDNGACSYCGKTLEEELQEKGKNLAIDHISSISNLGSNTIYNITLSCSSCNARKGNLDMLDFFLKHNPFSKERFETLVYKMFQVSTFQDYEFFKKILYVRYKRVTKQENIKPYETFFGKKEKRRETA